MSMEPTSGKRLREPPEWEKPTSVEVTLVCCGAPKLSMGWFHLTQLLADERATVRAVVEPWFLGAGKGKPGSEAFEKLVADNPSVTFCASIADVPQPEEPHPSQLFLIAGRTCDAPRLFDEALKWGATHIYVEKPGGESAAQLRTMRDAAEERLVPVIVGYNKNVADYAQHAITALKGYGPTLPKVTLQHCNDFEPGEPLVTFLKGPGGEGMLHNMCCHELALACTLFGVTCARVGSVELDAAASELIDLGDGKSDWSRVRFTLKLGPAAEGAPAPKGGVRLYELTFAADRCGGNYSRIELDRHGDTTEFRLPDAKHERWVKAQAISDPEIRPYFLQQAPDYQRLKGTFLKHILDEAAGIPDGVVGLDGAIEALALADMLVPALKAAWAGGAPWTWTPPDE